MKGFRWLVHCLALLAGACSGGGEDDGGVQPRFPRVPNPGADLPVSVTGGTMTPADLPLLAATDGSQFPLFITGKMAGFNTPVASDQKIFPGIDQPIHIGPDVSTESRTGSLQRLDSLRSLAQPTHGDTAILHGMSADDAGIDRDTLRSCLVGKR